MATLILTKEEKLALENNVLKESNFQMQINILQNERQTLINEICNKNDKTSNDISGINLQEGRIDFKDNKKDSKSRDK